MSQSATHQVRRQIRRALGPAVLGTLAEQAARLAILETFVGRLNTGFWRRVWWILTGRVRG